MKWFLVSFLVMLVSGCIVHEYEPGYPSSYSSSRVHVHPSRNNDIHRHGYTRPQHVEVQAAMAHRWRPLPPMPSNYHGHDMNNQANNQHGYG